MKEGTKILVADIIILIVASFILSIAINKCNAQSQKNDIIIYTSQFLAGCADGVNQAIAFHHIGRNNRFWDYDISWQNKYKNFPDDKRPAFFLSKSILVGFTDGYHMTRLVERAFQVSSTIPFFLGHRRTLKQFLKTTVISTISNRVGFILFYKVIFNKEG